MKRDPHKFAALARKYSIDTQSAQAGGELGFFARGAMVAAFERAAFSQRVGVIGKPVKSTYGYHIILVEAHKNVPVVRMRALHRYVPLIVRTPDTTPNRFSENRELGNEESGSRFSVVGSPFPGSMRIASTVS